MKKMRSILIIEDDPEIRGWIKGKLDRTGFPGSVCMADTLAGALESLENNMPDTVILDLTLPDGNGIDVLRKITQEKIPTRVYVFSVNTGMKNVCLRMGATAFFDKSGDGEFLIETLLNEVQQTLWQ